MTSPSCQFVRPVTQDRLLQRVESLGATVVLLEADGRAVPQGACRAVERLVLEAPLFAAAVRQVWPELLEAQGTVLELWPGLWLAPLPARGKRRAADPRPQTTAVLLMGHACLESEQFQQICQYHRVDFQAMAARADAAALVGPAETARLAAALNWMQQDTGEMVRRSGELQALSAQLAESYEEISLLYKLSASMTVDQPPVQFLTETCMDLQQTLGLRWMALLLIDNEPRLNELAGQVFLAGQVDGDPPLLQRVGQALITRLPSGGAPLVVDDVRSLHIPYLPQLAKHLLVVSLLREDRVLGILFGGDKVDGTPLGSVDSKLCSALAGSLAIFLENMMLYEDMQAMFLGTLHALTASIDAKDSYTHGHSERVAMVARQLAAAAGLDGHAAERVYLAGLVHDLGKIGVPESVLCKPGRLTAQEFTLVKMHPGIGARILQDIRSMQDLIPGVLCHHERWDGRGYPQGLAGQSIPISGRLIGLADAFDAMSSTRTYRASLKHEQVLAEIVRCSGSQFDPQLAQLFVGLDFTPFFQMVRTHQNQPGPIIHAPSSGPDMPGEGGRAQP